MDGPGDEFLARARLAVDQQRRGRRSRLLDDPVDLPHALAVADHLAERPVVAQLAPQRLHLAERPLPLDHLLQEDLQPLRVHRLGQVVVGAVLDRLDRRLDAALGREDHDADVDVHLAKRLQQLVAVHPRHHEVGDDDGRAERGDLLQGLLSILRRIRQEAPRANQLRQADPRGRVILDDQDPVPAAVALRDRQQLPPTSQAKRQPGGVLVEAGAVDELHPRQLARPGKLRQQAIDLPNDHPALVHRHRQHPSPQRCQSLGEQGCCSAQF